MNMLTRDADVWICDHHAQELAALLGIARRDAPVEGANDYRKLPALPVDFQGCLEDGTQDIRHLQAQLLLLGPLLHNGLRVVLTDADAEEGTECPGSLYFYGKYKMWVAIPDWPLRLPVSGLKTTRADGTFALEKDSWSLRHLTRNSPQNGLRVVLADSQDSSVEVQASLFFPEDEKVWVAIPDWPDFRLGEEGPSLEDSIKLIDRFNEQNSKQ